MKNRICAIFASIVLAIGFSLPYILLGDNLNNNAELGYLGLFVGTIVMNATVLLPSGSLAFVLIATTILNPYICVVVGSLGATIGDQTSYICGKVFGGLRSEIKNKKEAYPTCIEKLCDKYTFFCILLLAAAPLPIFDIAGLVAGKKSIKWTEYTIATFLGKLIKYGLFTLALSYIPQDYVNRLISTP